MRQHIRASISLGADPVAIRQHLREDFLSAPRVLTIQLPLSEFSIPGNLAISKEVTVQARLVQYDINMDDDLEIEFGAASGGQLFPTFRGVLDFYPIEDQQRSVLEITGTYEPPFGILGTLIDTTIGYLVAQRSVEQLLREIALHCSRDRVPSK